MSLFVKSNKIIYFALFIEAFSFWSFIPILPFIIETCLVCKEDLDYTAKMASFILLMYGLISFISAHFITKLCQKFGVKKIFILCLSCILLNNLILTFDLHINWVILSRIFAGFGSSVFLIATLLVNNLQENKNEQVTSLGNFTAANFLGMILASFTSGMITHFGSVSLVYYINSSLSLLALLFSLYLPKILLVHEEENVIKGNIFIYLKTIFSDIKKFYFKNKLVTFLATLISITFIANESIQISWAFFTSEKLHWNENLIGLSMSILGIVTIVTQLFFIKPLTGFHKLKFSILIGLVLFCIANIFLSFFNNNVFIWFGIILVGLSSISTPFVKTLYNSMFSGQNINQAVVFISRLEAFFEFIIPFIVLNIFALFSNKNTKIYFPSIIFLISLIIFGFMFVWFLKLNKHKSFFLNKNKGNI